MAEADAERRHLPELKTVLQGLAAATRQLRDAPWNDEASSVRPPASTEETT